MSGRRSYIEQLHPWCVVQLLPNLQNRVVARFRCCSHAEEYVHSIRPLLPTRTYKIVFEPPSTRQRCPTKT